MISSRDRGGRPQVEISNFMAKSYLSLHTSSLEEISVLQFALPISKSNNLIQILGFPALIMRSNS